MTVDLALEYMGSTVPLIPECLAANGLSPLPHNTVYFDLTIHPVRDQFNQIGMSIDHPNKHGKFMPPLHVLQHLVNTCYPTHVRPLLPGGVTISYFTGLPLNGAIARANPAFDIKGPWFDFINAYFENTPGHMYMAPARDELMYFLSSDQ